MFLGGVRALETLVQAQALEFGHRGLSPPAIDPAVVGGVARLASARNATGERLMLLTHMVEEVARRQDILTKSQSSREITLAAFVGATHKLRTALDLTLSCSEEIDDIFNENGSIQQIQPPAKAIANATRWSVIYAEELSDLALFSFEPAGVHSVFSTGATLNGVVSRLQPIAVRAGIELSAVAFEDCYLESDLRSFERCIRYLILVALGGQRVGKVVLTAAQQQGETVISISDDGKAATVEERAALTSHGSLSTQSTAMAADAAGYAVARRLVAALGGRIDLTVQPGRGTTCEVILPNCSP